MCVSFIYMCCGWTQHRCLVGEDHRLDFQSSLGSIKGKHYSYIGENIALIEITFPSLLLRLRQAFFCITHFVKCHV